MKKVYFACSIRGGRDDADVYKKIVDFLSSRSKLLTEIFADQKLTSMGMNKPNKDIFKTDIEWIKQSDILIAEVSNPSLGVGYEIAKAEELGIPILCLYRTQPNKKLSAMIAGNPKIQVEEYKDIKDVFKKINNFLEI